MKTYSSMLDSAVGCAERLGEYRERLRVTRDKRERERLQMLIGHYEVMLADWRYLVTSQEVREMRDAIAHQ